MEILARLHPAPTGTIVESHETFLTDSSFLTNHRLRVSKLLQEP